MKILSIETSCDETAVSIIKASGKAESPIIKVLGNALFSQAKLHEKFGGVYPNLAKREHARNLPRLLHKALSEAKLIRKSKLPSLSPKEKARIEKELIRENQMADDLIVMLGKIKKPSIDAIAVTQGPGLEPALWVGISMAKTLGFTWEIPIIPINHMEGHILSVLYNPKKEKNVLPFPALALLVSGGHTELVLMSKLLSYKLLGRTRDDAVGEAYDKVARMMNLPYPGGPVVAALAEKSRKIGKKNSWVFPRPMIHSDDFDFSFSGLKTAVLYGIDKKKLSPRQKEFVAEAFEDAVVEVLIHKTRLALKKYKVRSLILGGGVIANTHIRLAFEKLVKDFPEVTLFMPTKELSTDNSIMIGVAGYVRAKSIPQKSKKKGAFSAIGNLRLSS